jgi:AcrR family transcriptional regulator
VNETRRKLLDGAMETLRTIGIAGISARTIAAAAGVNQALVFYHFGSVDQLIDAACRDGASARVQTYREQFAEVTSLRELLTLGRDLHAQERVSGNVTVMAQILAGAQQDPKLAAGGRHALTLWVNEIETVLDRLLRNNPVAAVIDIPGLARGIAAAFIGIELYDGVDPASAEQALSALEQLSVLVEVVEDLGPVARRALRRRVAATTREWAVVPRVGSFKRPLAP